MENFIREQNEFNKNISEKLNKYEIEHLEHGKRLNVLEKEINTMSSRFEKMSSVLEKVHDKLDNHTEYINDIRVQLPTLLNEMVDKNAKRTEEIVTTHQVKCAKELDNKYVMMPEGWKGYAVRIVLLIMAGLFGLDLTGVMPIVSKPTIPVSSKLNHVGHTLTLQDANGQVYYLRSENASGSMK